MPRIRLPHPATQPPAAGTADAQRFVLGTRSLADLIAPAAVEVARDHLRVDAHYARTLMVTGYPRSVGPGWLSPLIDFAEPLELSLHAYPLDTGEMVAALTRKLVQLQSSRLLAARHGRLADPEREVAYTDAERLRDALQRGDERVFSVSLYLLLRAPSLAALDTRTRQVETLLAGMLAHSRVALFEQDAGFHACLPEGRDTLRVYRNLETISLATMFPFTSGTLAMERGVLYGVATHNHAPVIVDPFDGRLENANLVIFAQSGAGKSYFTKLLALRTLLAGVDFLVVDPEGEYRTLCAAVDGQAVRLASAAGQRLNPFDLAPLAEGDAGRDALAEQVTALLGLLDLMLAEPGRALVGRCPFHTDRGRPNLHVYPESYRWYCYRCGLGGDAIDFIRRQEQCGFAEACQRLDGGPQSFASPANAAPPAPSPRRWDRLTLEEQVVMNTAGALYQHALWREPRALAYLRERALPDRVIRAGALGYADGHSLEAYLRRRSGLRAAQALGLLRKPAPGDEGRPLREFFAGRVVVPEIRGGQCVWFIGRTLADEPGRPKYLALGGERPVLGFERAVGRWQAFLCEGVFDYLTAVGWRLPAFSPCGTALPAERLGFLARAERIYGCLDDDVAGQAAADVPLLERTTARQRLPLPFTVARGCPIGVSRHQGRSVPVALPDELHRRHLLLVAKTRRGKSSLLLHLARYFMEREGPDGSPPALVLVDPHQDLARAALGCVPTACHDAVVYLDVAERQRPFGLNLLDTFLFGDRDKAVANTLTIFRREFDRFWGPRMEDAFRFALLTLYEVNQAIWAAGPRGRARQHTILEVPALLADPAFRRGLIAQVADPVITAWWVSYFDPLDRRLQLEIANPVQTKVQRFAGSRAARAIVGQPGSTVDPAAWILAGAIVILNTAKGTVGEDTAALIGATLLHCVALAIEEQAAREPRHRRPVTILVDEFHSLPGTDYEAILSELAKYGANLVLATQSLARLEALDREQHRALRATVFANLDGLFVFHVSAEDAQYLVRELGAEVDVHDLGALGEYRCYVRISVGGERLPTFSVRLDPPPAPDPILAGQLAAASARRHGRDGAAVEQDLRAALARSARGQRIGPTVGPAGQGDVGVVRGAATTDGHVYRSARPQPPRNEHRRSKPRRVEAHQAMLFDAALAEPEGAGDEARPEDERDEASEEPEGSRP